MSPAAFHCRRPAVRLSLALALVWLALPSGFLAAQYPLALTDASGASVSLKAAPVRIVSLTLYSDEVLMDLVPPERLAALSVYAADPHLSNLTPERIKGKTLTDLNVEFVLGLRPDLVLVADWSDAAKVALLRRAGVPVFALATPVDVAGMKVGILTLGRLCGAGAAAERLVAGVDARLAAVRQALDTPARSLSALDYNSWGSSNGAGSTWDNLLRLAGLQNAAARLPAGPFGQVSLSRELIVTLNPDLVFLPDWIYGTADDSNRFAASVKADPVLGVLKAWKNRQVHIMPERLKSTVSQYMVDAVEYLAATAWPERFPAAKRP